MVFTFVNAKFRPNLESVQNAVELPRQVCNKVRYPRGDTVAPRSVTFQRKNTPTAEEEITECVCP
jgi:hypothetical protein